MSEKKEENTEFVFNFDSVEANGNDGFVFSSDQFSNDPNSTFTFNFDDNKAFDNLNSNGNDFNPFGEVKPMDSNENNENKNEEISGKTFNPFGNDQQTTPQTNSDFAPFGNEQNVSKNEENQNKINVLKNEETKNDFNPFGQQEPAKTEQKQEQQETSFNPFIVTETDKNQQLTSNNTKDDSKEHKNSFDAFAIPSTNNSSNENLFSQAAPADQIPKNNSNQQTISFDFNFLSNNISVAQPMPETAANISVSSIPPAPPNSLIDIDSNAIDEPESPIPKSNTKDVIFIPPVTSDDMIVNNQGLTEARAMSTNNLFDSIPSPPPSPPVSLATSKSASTNDLFNQPTEEDIFFGIGSPSQETITSNITASPLQSPMTPNISATDDLFDIFTSNSSQNSSKVDLFEGFLDFETKPKQEEPKPEAIEDEKTEETIEEFKEEEEKIESKEKEISTEEANLSNEENQKAPKQDETPITQEEPTTQQPENADTEKEVSEEKAEVPQKQDEANDVPQEGRAEENVSTEQNDDGFTFNFNNSQEEFQFNFDNQGEFQFNFDQNASFNPFGDDGTDANQQGEQQSADFNPFGNQENTEKPTEVKQTEEFNPFGSQENTQNSPETKQSEGFNPFGSSDAKEVKQNTAFNPFGSSGESSQEKPKEEIKPESSTSQAQNKIPQESSTAQKAVAIKEEKKVIKEPKKTIPVSSPISVLYHQDDVSHHHDPSNLPSTSKQVSLNELFEIAASSDFNEGKVDFDALFNKEDPYNNSRSAFDFLIQ